MRKDDGWWTIPDWMGTLHCKCGREWSEGDQVWLAEGTGYLYCPACIPSPRQAVEAQEAQQQATPKRAHQRVAEWMAYE